MQYDTKGLHVIADLWGIDANKLNNLEYLMNCLIEAVERSGATILGHVHHKFHPVGVTIVLMLSESHMSVHTYPEHGYASFDCYTCGSADPQRAIDYLIDELKPIYKQIQKIERGVQKR